MPKNDLARFVPKIQHILLAIYNSPCKQLPAIKRRIDFIQSKIDTLSKSRWQDADKLESLLTCAVTH